MNRTKYLKGECQHCQGHLEFLVDHIGMTVPCPHCGQQTELLLPQPPQEPSIPTRAIVWTLVAVVVLGMGLVGSLVALKKAQRWAASQKRQSTSLPVESTNSVQAALPVADPPSTNELAASEVTIDHVAGSHLIYAVGTVKNNSDRRRFGVKVELELADGSGQKIGTATDYVQVLEPGAQWPFKALVVDAKTKSARVTAIREDQ
ncbi:MAG TPA: FxLYD domain-containing protein [Verrucomicrobiae bacterium]|nr:FxLYD domain-containing protein [Verrucomicrobiae bacterium]